MSLQNSDELVNSLLSTLNNNKNSPKVAFTLGQEETPTDLKDWVETGSDLLDIAISNRAYAGVPSGRIIELQGLEGSGKSLILAHMLANTQKKGGVAVLIDTENAVNEDFFKAVGVDLEKLIYIPLDTIEDVMQTVENIITTVRLKNKNKLITIGVDSIAGASTKMELEEGYERKGYITGKAIILSASLRKLTNLLGRQRVLLVFTNQLRDKVDAFGWGDKYTTPGGKAVGFHSSCRIRLSVVGKLTKTIDKVKQVYGVQVLAKIIKNRFGPPHRECVFNIYFSSGIDNFDSLFEAYTKLQICKKDGDGILYSPDVLENSITSEEFRDLKPFKFKNKQHFAEEYNKYQFKDEMYNKLVNKLVTKYDIVSPDIGDGSIEIDTEDRSGL